MEILRKHWLLVLFLIVWLPSFATLWPFPSESSALQASSVFQNLTQDRDKIKHLYTESEWKKLDREVEVLTKSENLLALFWHRWLVRMVVVALGLAAVFYAARRGKYWTTGLVVTSSCYLTLINGFPISRAVRTEQWSLWWQMLSQYPDGGIAAIIYGVVLPLMHVVLIAGLVFSGLLVTYKNGNLTLHSRRTR